MKWIQTHALTARQQEQIRSLQETCRRAEPFGHSVFLSGELNHFGEMDCFFLGYEGQALAAVLTLFQPDAREAEVTAFGPPRAAAAGAPLPRSLPPPGRAGTLRRLFGAVLPRAGVRQRGRSAQALSSGAPPYGISDGI